MRLRMLACTFIAFALAPAFASAQATGNQQTTSGSRSIFSNLANPSMGMNALFLGQIAPDLNEPYNLHFDEAELSAISVVDHYFTFWSNIVFTGTGEVDPEEVVVSTNAIPGIYLKFGKIRGDFGKHGLLHTHAFPFIQAPVIMANTIGEEGFKDSGAEASWLTPLPWYATITGGMYAALEPGDENPLDFGSMEHQNVPWLGNFSNEFNLNESTTLDVGGSVIEGRGTDGHRHSAYGGDITIRNVPLRRSNQKGWTLQGEYIQRGTNVGDTYIKESNGWYAHFKYRLNQVWWVGVRGEQAKNCFTDVLVDSSGAIPGKVTRGSANIAWSPSEFSTVRLEYSYAKCDDGNGFKPTDQRVMVQGSFTVGFHPAHAY